MPHRETAGSGDGAGAGHPRGDSGVGIGDDVAGGVGRRLGKGGVCCFVCLANGYGFGGGVVVCWGSVNGTASVRSGGVHSVRLQSDISLSAGNMVVAFRALQQGIGSESRHTVGGGVQPLMLTTAVRHGWEVTMRQHMGQGGIEQMQALQVAAEKSPICDSCATAPWQFSKLES